MLRATSFCTVFLGIFLIGCSGPGPIVQRPLTTQVSESFRPLRINAVAILPLEAGVTRNQVQIDPATVTDQLLQAFQANTSLEIANLKDGKRTGEVLAELAGKNDTVQGKALELGRQLGVQGVIYGVLSRYLESNGETAGAGYGGVSYRLWLIDANNGRPLWSATYEKTNQPLSDNILRMGEVFKSGMRYKKPADLLQKGLIDAAIALEKLRHEGA